MALHRSHLLMARSLARFSTATDYARPRYYVTNDDLVIMASEVGVLPWVKSADVVKKGRLEPGRMFLVDTEEGRIIDDAELKEKIMSEKPYGEWLGSKLISEDDLEAPEKEVPGLNQDTLLQRQRAFGYTFEDKRFLIGPSCETGVQPIGSMGNDAPLAVLSDKPQLLYNYFKQLFAQVTNPPIDPIREELVTATVTFLGSEGDIVNPGPNSCRMIKLESPLIDNYRLQQLRELKKRASRQRPYLSCSNRLLSIWTPVTAASLSHPSPASAWSQLWSIFLNMPIMRSMTV